MWWFGLPVVEHSPATWGARAIHCAAGFELLGDRQGTDGDPQAVKKLMAALNGGILAKCREEFKRLENTYEIKPHAANLVTLYNADGIKVEADTRGSHGYVYLRAYIVPPRVEPYGYKEVHKDSRTQEAYIVLFHVTGAVLVDRSYRRIQTVPQRDGLALVAPHPLPGGRGKPPTREGGRHAEDLRWWRSTP